MLTSLFSSAIVVSDESQTECSYQTCSLSSIIYDCKLNLAHLLSQQCMMEIMCAY